MKNEMNQSNQGNGYRTATWLLGILLAVAIASIFWFVQEKNSHQSHATTLKDQLLELDEVKDTLEQDLVNLQGEYEGQILDNDTLRIDLEGKLAEVKNLQYRIAQAKQQVAESQTNAASIRDRLAQMESLKIALEHDILSLKEENVALRDTNESLQIVLEESQQEIATLNTQMAIMTSENLTLQKKLYVIAPAGIKADNFMISAEQKNDKLTSKAKRADEIQVSFSIDNVPGELQGKRDIYLVLTEFNGNPVDRVASKEMKVSASDTPFNVNAADIETIDLTDRQKLTMSFRPEADLEPGTYNVLVYADNGFLGSTGLKLR